MYALEDLPMRVPSSWFGCQAHISPHVIVQALAELDRYEVFFRRQLHNNYVAYWIFKALSRHKSFGCKRSYGKYGLFYTVQACKFVTARFCYRANWTHVDTRIIVLIQTSVCDTMSFTQLTKPISAVVSIHFHCI